MILTVYAIMLPQQRVGGGWLAMNLIATIVCDFCYNYSSLFSLMQIAGGDQSDVDSDMDDLTPLHLVNETESRLPPLHPDDAHGTAQGPITPVPTTTNGDIPPHSNLDGLSKQEHPKLLDRIPGGENLLQQIRNDQYAAHRQENIHYPFRSRGDWQLGQWLTNSSLTQAQIDSFLKLEEVSNLVITS